MSGEKSQIILAGEGGQGLLFIGMILGEAAIKEGKNAAQAASYGIASRGGFSMAEVVISSAEILFPGVTQPDLILALSAAALDKYVSDLSPGCLLVYDGDAVNQPEIQAEDKDRILPLPLSSAAAGLARQKGKKVLLNIVALGAVAGLSAIVTRQALEAVFREKFSAAEALEDNLEALYLGYELVDSRYKNQEIRSKKNKSKKIRAEHD